jgi:hypothetical protein
LSNPNVSPEARAHAEKMLAEAGVSQPASTETTDQHEKNVLAGYKGVLSSEFVVILELAEIITPLLY